MVQSIIIFYVIMIIITPWQAVESNRSYKLQSAPAVIVQGIDFGWQRKFFGFSTPHRMGSLQWASTASPSCHRNITNVTSTMTFTPGVDGDFAFPQIRYTQLKHADDEHNLVATGFIFQSQVVNLRGYDHILNPDAEAPSARISWINVVEIPQYSPRRYAILSGFRLNMTCIANETLGCSICNSNGAWFTVFSVLLQHCNGSSCKLNVTLERGWTPSHGGGKPLSSCLHYDLSIEIHFVAATNISYKTLEYTASLFHPIKNQTAFLDWPITVAPHVLVGVQGFQFNLSSSPAYPQRGRYIERFAWGVTQPRKQTNHKGTPILAYDANIFIQSPQATTYPCNVTYMLNTTALLLPIHAQTTPSQVAQGTVCKDDPLSGFYCVHNNLPKQLTDHILKATTCIS